MYLSSHISDFMENFLLSYFSEGNATDLPCLMLPLWHS